MASLNFAVPVDDLYSLQEYEQPIDLQTFKKRLERVRQEIAEPHFESAQIAFEREQFELAGRLLEKVLHLFPKHERALLLSGRIAMEGGQLQRAGGLFQQAVDAWPESADAWYFLGSIHDRMSAALNSAPDLDRAQVAYEKSLELDEQQSLAAYRLAVIHLGQGYTQRAEELLQLAIQSQPGLADAHYLRGEIYLERELYREAESAFEQALWENSEHALSHFGLARLYMVSAGKVRGDPERHWKDFLRLSRGVPSLQRERNLALRIVEEYYPRVLDR